MNGHEQQLLAALATHPTLAPRDPRALRIVADVRGNITRLHQVELTFAAGPLERYWLKSYEGKPHDAETEWAFLQVPAEHAGYHLVEAVAYVPALEAVVTRHADGERLSDRLLRDPEHADVRAAGAWLGLLHQTIHPGGSFHPREALVDDVARRASAVAVMFRLDLRSTLMTVQAQAAALAPSDLLRVRTHGDFGPFNILVRPDGGTVIDPSFEPSVARLQNFCTRHEDYARFLTCLAAVESPTAERRQQLDEQFRAGYAETSGIDPTASPALGLLRVKYGLQALLDRWPRFIAEARRRGMHELLETWLEGKR
jgi:hypothetical protein